MAQQQISVLIADDELLICEILALLLEREGFRVVGTARSANATVKLARLVRPDVILLDVTLNGQAALHVLPALRRMVPNAQVLILSAWSEPEYLARAIIHSIAGYLTKDIPPSQLIRAIRTATMGGSRHDRETIEAAIDVLAGELAGRRDSSLSPADSEFTLQETRILTLVAEGMNNGEIAELLQLSGTTVKTHLSRVLHKLSLPDRTSAAAWAHRQRRQRETISRERRAGISTHRKVADRQ